MARPTAAPCLEVVHSVLGLRRNWIVLEATVLQKTIDLEVSVNKCRETTRFGPHGEAT